MKISPLREYYAATDKNPKMGLKDNLINIVHQEKNEALFGGCTGHGCGAAFNFLALLPDGEVHACRKFPSLVGNITKHNLYDIYHTDLAERYRTGSRACRNCRLNPVCRGAWPSPTAWAWTSSRTKIPSASHPIRSPANKDHRKGNQQLKPLMSNREPATFR